MAGTENQNYEDARITNGIAINEWDGRSIKNHHHLILGADLVGMYISVGSPISLTCFVVITSLQD